MGYYAADVASGTEISPITMEINLSIGILESGVLLLFFVVLVSLIGPIIFPLYLPLCFAWYEQIYTS